jgi:hypothetical protein
MTTVGTTHAEEARKRWEAAATIEVGALVEYRGGFGGGALTMATVTGLVDTVDGESKYGKPVHGVTMAELRERAGRRFILDLSDGHWAYGFQVTQLIGEAD